jgi:hypothetical protein
LLAAVFTQTSGSASPERLFSVWKTELALAVEEEHDNDPAC